MKQILVIANVAFAIALVVMGVMAAGAHRTYAYSVYRELQDKRVLVERPDYDVARRLQTIAAGGSHLSTLAWLGAGACLVNVVAIGFCFKETEPKLD